MATSDNKKILYLVNFNGKVACICDDKELYSEYKDLYQKAQVKKEINKLRELEDSIKTFEEWKKNPKF